MVFGVATQDVRSWWCPLFLRVDGNHARPRRGLGRLRHSCESRYKFRQGPHDDQVRRRRPTNDPNNWREKAIVDRFPVSSELFARSQQCWHLAPLPCLLQRPAHLSTLGFAAAPLDGLPAELQGG